MALTLLVSPRVSHVFESPLLASDAPVLGKDRPPGSTPGGSSTGGTFMIVEIRSAEGGDDAKLLVEEQLSIYTRLGIRRGL